MKTKNLIPAIVVGLLAASLLLNVLFYSALDNKESELDCAKSSIASQKFVSHTWLATLKKAFSHLEKNNIDLETGERKDPAKP